MKKALQLLSVLALAWTIAPAALFLAGSITLAQVKLHMLLATVLWFATCPFWMARDEG